MSDPNADPTNASDATMAGRPSEATGDLQPHATSPITAYGELDPGQTRDAARVFIERFRQLDDPEAQRYAALDPDGVLPSQLHEMHRFASQRHPEVLAGILSHPAVADPMPDEFTAGEQARLNNGGSPNTPR